MLRADGKVFLHWTVLILLIPLKLLLFAVFAACVHELFHAAAVLLFRGKIRCLLIRPVGVLMETEGIGGWAEVLCALAGPFGSLLLFLMIRQFPMLGLCGLIQGVFNLLPVYPLDGGRAVRGMLTVLCPERGEMIAEKIEYAILLILMVVSIFCAIWYSLGLFPVLFCAAMIVNAILRKRP